MYSSLKICLAEESLEKFRNLSYKIGVLLGGIVIIAGILGGLFEFSEKWFVWIKYVLGIAFLIVGAGLFSIFVENTYRFFK